MVGFEREIFISLVLQELENERKAMEKNTK